MFFRRKSMPLLTRGIAMAKVGKASFALNGPPGSSNEVDSPLREKKSTSDSSIKIRKNFLETWLWNESYVGYGISTNLLNRMSYTKQSFQ